MRKLGLVFVLVACVSPAWATVLTTGDVDPGGAAIQPDPWNVGGDVKVGDSGEGTLNVEAGGEVLTTYASCYIGYNSGSTGVATVTGAGSTWANTISL